MFSNTSFLVAAFIASAAAATCPIDSSATNLIQGYEKFRSSPYNDGYGYWTVGYGHRVCDALEGIATYLIL